MLFYRGTSLIEVLISLLLLSLFLLGFDAMQMASLRAAKADYYFHVATSQLEFIRERLIIAKNIHEELANWNQLNQQVLPQGIGFIEGDYPNFHISVAWGGLHSCKQNKVGRTGCVSAVIIV